MAALFLAKWVLVHLQSPALELPDRSQAMIRGSREYMQPEL